MESIIYPPPMRKGSALSQFSSAALFFTSEVQEASQTDLHCRSDDIEKVET